MNDTLDHLTDDDRAMLTEAPASGATAVASRSRWAGLLAPYGVESGDGRVITGGITARNLPLFLRWQPNDAERHDGAVAVGRILAAGSREDVIAAGFSDVPDDGPGIYGGGDLFDASQYSGDSAAAIVAATNQMSDGLGLVSVDLVACDGRFEGERLVVTSGELAAATLVDVPAFATAKVSLSPELEAALGGDHGRVTLQGEGTPTRLASLSFAVQMSDRGGPRLQGSDDRMFAVTGSTSLPIGPARSWDGPRAAGRMLDAATGEGGTINVGTASRGFFWHDDDGSKRGDYKLPFADLVDGGLQVIPAGVSAVLSRLDSTDIPGSAKATIRRKAETLQARIERQQDAAAREAAEAAIAPADGPEDSPGEDDCPEGQHRMPDGECMPDADMSALDRRMEVAALDARLEAAGRG